MKHSIKWISVLLLLSMLAASLAACGGDKPAVTTPTPGTSGNEPNTTPAPDTGEQLVVPDTTYGGYTFVFLTAGQVAYNDFDFNEDASAVVDVAQYQRKSRVEEQFDIIIEQQKVENKSASATPGYEKIRQAHTAQESMYDLCNLGGYCSAKSAAANYLYDLNSTTYIDTSKSWWDQNANDDLTLDGVLFFTNGSLSGARSESTFVIFYNKTLGETKQLEAPYQLVRDNKWTLDVFASMCLEVSEEMTGDDTRGPMDRYGLYCWDDAMIGIMAASGTRCVTVNSDGEMEMTLYSERSEEAFNKFTSIVYNKDYCLTYQRYSGQMSVLDNWRNNLALFWATSNVNTPNMLDMESDFSILPYPMLNEAQGRYYSTIAPYNSQFISMPAIQEDEERASAIIEALAYEGQKILTPALYEKTLKTNQVRDEDTADMLDIIYGSYMYDLGYYFSIAQITTQLMNLLRNYNTGFASMWASTEKAANAQITRFNSDLAKAIESWKVG